VSGQNPIARCIYSREMLEYKRDTRKEFCSITLQFLRHHQPCATQILFP